MKKYLLVFLLGTVQLSNARKTPHHPEIFDISDVTVGAQKLDTSFLYAVGKWSDATIRAGAMSTEIHCYKRFGFCEVASADSISEGPAIESVYEPGDEVSFFLAQFCDVHHPATE